MAEFDKSRKIAFLPGTSGIGKALAKNLAKAGFKILIGGVKLGEAKAAVKDIQKAAGSACPLLEAHDLKGAAEKAKVVFFALSVSAVCAVVSGSFSAICSVFTVPVTQLQAEGLPAMLTTGQPSREEGPSATAPV